MDVEPNSNIQIGSVITFKKSDGSTNVFKARVSNIKENYTWTLELKANGFELLGKLVEKVYDTTTPEAIVQDIFDNHTDTLSYASTETSGITIDKYIASGYAIDVVRDMINSLGWNLYIDESDNVYFEPEGYTDSGVTFTNGEDSSVSDWERDETQIVNKARLIGGFESYNTSETVTGTGTTFSLSFKPTGSFKAVVSGSTISPDEYTVNNEDKTVIFDSSQTDPTFTYTYSRPVIVERQNDNSITEYKEHFKKIPAPYINSFSDARIFLRKYISTYSVPLRRGKVTYGGIRFDIEVNNLIQVVDNVRDNTGAFAVYKIVYDMKKGTTTYHFGTPEVFIRDSMTEIERRIKDLERRSTSEDKKTFVRTITDDLNISLSRKVTISYNSPVDSFILGHWSRGRLRTNLNLEPDCGDFPSSGSNVMTWNNNSYSVVAHPYNNSFSYNVSVGNFTGSEYLSKSTFGSSGLNMVNFFIYPTVDNVAFLRLTSSNIISIIGGQLSLSGADFTGASVYINTTLKSVGSRNIPLNEWSMVSIVTTSIISTGTVYIGTDLSTYYQGYIKNVGFFTGGYNSTLINDLYSGAFSNDHANYSDCISYYAFDNPRLGDRSSSETNIQVIQ